MTKYVKVPVGTMIELLTTANVYMALTNGGVDNWEWYGESISQFEDEHGDIDATEKDVFDLYEKVE